MIVSYIEDIVTHNLIGNIFMHVRYVIGTLTDGRIRHVRYVISTLTDSYNMH